MAAHNITTDVENMTDATTNMMFSPVSQAVISVFWERDSLGVNSAEHKVYGYCHSCGVEFEVCAVPVQERFEKGPRAKVIYTMGASITHQSIEQNHLLSHHVGTPDSAITVLNATPWFTDRTGLNYKLLKPLFLTTLEDPVPLIKHLVGLSTVADRSSDPLSRIQEQNWFSQPKG